MAITVKYLTGLGIDEETANKIFAERGKEIEADKAKYAELENKLTEKENSFNTLTQEFETLKANKANSEDWEKKFNDLQTEIAEKEKQEKAEKEKAEREAEIQNRYNAVCVDKDGKPLEFAHEAIRAEYLKKFGEILSDTDNAEYKGKSDAEIFHALTKDDAAAFKGVQASLDLPGGKQFGGGAEPTTLLSALREQYGK